MAVDKTLVRELELFGDNDQACYKKLMAINENYALKRKRGVWDKKHLLLVVIVKSLVWVQLAKKIKWL